MLASLISQGMVVGCWLGDCVGMSGGLWPMVHAIPSGLVITRFPVPSIETATKRPFPQVTLDHWLSAALAWLLRRRASVPRRLDPVSHSRVCDGYERSVPKRD